MNSQEFLKIIKWEQLVFINYNPSFKLIINYKKVWGPLCAGILTGKYNNGVPEEARLNMIGPSKSMYDKHLLDPKIYDSRIKQLTALGEVAKELGCS